MHALNQFAIEREERMGWRDVHLIPDEYRVRVNWGGYSMVNATLQIMNYCLGRLDYDGGSNRGGGYVKGKELEFHKFVHISASRYVSDATA